MQTRIGLVIFPVDRGRREQAVAEPRCEDERNRERDDHPGTGVLPDGAGSETTVPMDVLDDDDRVVDEDSDREDQCEKRDAIDRESPCP